jgi:hypothetical protein
MTTSTRTYFAFIFFVVYFPATAQRLIFNVDRKGGRTILWNATDTIVFDKYKGIEGGKQRQVRINRKIYTEIVTKHESEVMQRIIDPEGQTVARIPLNGYSKNKLSLPSGDNFVFVTEKRKWTYSKSSTEGVSCKKIDGDRRMVEIQFRPDTKKEDALIISLLERSLATESSRTAAILAAIAIPLVLTLSQGAM